MLPLKFAQQEELRVLFLGAHCDDIEIGCGGTIMRLCKEYKHLNVQWVVFTSTTERMVEAKRCAAHFLEPVKNKEIKVLNFLDGYLPAEAVSIKNYFEELKSFKPDIIFTHYRHDLHQDHRLICELTWNTFRNHLVFEYEIPKYDGDLGNPNFFVTLDQGIAERKADALMKYFHSQASKHWFDRETFFSLMRIRGLQSACQDRYAEAFYVRKATF